MLDWHADRMKDCPYRQADIFEVGSKPRKIAIAKPI
jgi:hypothetical protein